MSGTSADGIDVALVRVTGRKFNVRIKLLHHSHTAYSAQGRKAVLKAMNADSTSVADLSRLNFFLGELYADAVLKARKSAGVARLDLVGCHGQTIYHQGEAANYLGKPIATTWQTCRQVRVVPEAAIATARILPSSKWWADSCCW